MRWLLLKDLQILRRSPFLVAVLIAYPIIISVLIGLALSRGPDKPRIAVLNELPAGATSFSVGGQRLDVSRYARELFKSVSPIPVDTRAQAIEKVRSGEALGALAARGTAIVFSTHNVGEAERYADRVLVLADGEVLFIGSPAQLEALVGGDPRDFEAAFVRFLHERGH